MPSQRSLRMRLTKSATRRCSGGTSGITSSSVGVVRRYPPFATVLVAPEGKWRPDFQPAYRTKTTSGNSRFFSENRRRQALGAGSPRSRSRPAEPRCAAAEQIVHALRRVRPASTEAAETAGRVVRLAKLAEQIFGDKAKAARWLGKPKVALCGKAPLNCLGDEQGERIVEEMLFRIDSGILT